MAQAIRDSVQSQIAASRSTGWNTRVGEKTDTHQCAHRSLCSSLVPSHPSRCPDAQGILRWRASPPHQAPPLVRKSAKQDQFLVCALRRRHL